MEFEGGDDYDDKTIAYINRDMNHNKTAHTYTQARLAISHLYSYSYINSSLNNF